MKVVVTGGSGFLGSHIADALSAAGHETVIFDVAPSPWLQPNQTMVVGSVLDPDKITSALRGTEAIYHLAAMADIADTLAELQELPQFNGRAAVMGFCYGGPYAILGPKRLGFAAGISCHGTRMQDYIGELEGIVTPVCIIWGDEDNQAPPEVLEVFRAVPPRMKNVELHIFPGVKHAYMMPDAGAAFSAKTRAFSMTRALAILNDLRGGGERLRKAS